MDGVKDGIVSYNNLLYYSIITTVENGEQEKNTVWFYKKFFRCFFLECSFLFFNIKDIWYINKYKQLDHTASPLHHCRQMANNLLRDSTSWPGTFSSFPPLWKKKKAEPVAVIIYYLLTKKIILFT